MLLYIIPPLPLKLSEMTLEPLKTVSRGIAQFKDKPGVKHIRVVGPVI